ncbi:Multi antimicrobial extrusion protein [Artemisia annua]|uniref:Multi antimicrobial extrusion protein n=1 Tax=Artemisia annua TaxID=35608 RepID=A0A2U1PY18_ARTAN|nr:Multi antimicrobial extrusion protein [Artemisia annua]
MVVVKVSQNLLRVASMSMVGHLGELELAGTAVANITGFSLLEITRVSNELGAGNPQAAKTSIMAASALGVVEVIIDITTLMCSRTIQYKQFFQELLEGVGGKVILSRWNSYGSILCFVAHLNGKGLWSGPIIGSIVQCTLLTLAAKSRELIIVWEITDEE